MCECVKDTGLVAGFICCECRSYNGLQRGACRACGEPRCTPLTPNVETGESFETYEEAYRDDPDMLRRVREQLVIHSRPEPSN